MRQPKLARARCQTSDAKTRISGEQSNNYIYHDISFNWRTPMLSAISQPKSIRRWSDGMTFFLPWAHNHWSRSAFVDNTISSIEVVSWFQTSLLCICFPKAPTQHAYLSHHILSISHQYLFKPSAKFSGATWSTQTTALCQTSWAKRQWTKQCNIVSFSVWQIGKSSVKFTCLIFSWTCVGRQPTQAFHNKSFTFGGIFKFQSSCQKAEFAFSDHLH